MHWLSQLSFLHNTRFLPTTLSSMSFFKRKDKTLIPPIQSELAPPSGASRSSSRTTSPLPSYRSNASTYVPSRDGLDPYNTTGRSKSQSRVDDYESPVLKSNTSDAPSQLDRARGELFAGYNPEKAGSGRFFDGPGIGREPPPGEENEEDVEGIKQQTRFLKQESVNSTRNALRMAREAEETARGTLGRLADQSGAPDFFDRNLVIIASSQRNWQTLNATLMCPSLILCGQKIRLTNSRNSIDRFSVQR
jgi:hypothetical protein